MKNKLTEEQIGVIIEAIQYIKNKSGVVTVGMVKKRITYDFIHGKGQAVELLNDNFHDIISNNALFKYQIKQLAQEISRRENKWIVGTLDELNFNDVIGDGYGYVIISDGTRIDIDSEMYKQERDEFNKVRTERLKKSPTNGKEYIKPLKQ